MALCRGKPCNSSRASRLASGRGRVASDGATGRSEHGQCAAQDVAAVAAEADVRDERTRPTAASSCSSYYREMLLIRRFEEKAGQLYGMGLIGGFCHLYIGQEAVAVGIQHALQPGDR